MKFMSNILKLSQYIIIQKQRPWGRPRPWARLPSLMGRQRMQGPSQSLSRVFIRVMFTESNFGGEHSLPPGQRWLLILKSKCFTLWGNTSACVILTWGAPCHPVGPGRQRDWPQHEADAACCDLSKRLLSLSPELHVFGWQPSAVAVNSVALSK